MPNGKKFAYVMNLSEDFKDINPTFMYYGRDNLHLEGRIFEDVAGVEVGTSLIIEEIDSYLMEDNILHIWCKSKKDLEGLIITGDLKFTKYHVPYEIKAVHVYDAGQRKVVPK